MDEQSEFGIAPPLHIILGQEQRRINDILALRSIGQSNNRNYCDEQSLHSDIPFC